MLVIHREVMGYANRANLSAGMLEGNGFSRDCCWLQINPKKNMSKLKEEAQKQFKQKTLTKVSELGCQLAPFPTELW